MDQEYWNKCANGGKLASCKVERAPEHPLDIICISVYKTLFCISLSILEFTELQNYVKTLNGQIQTTGKSKQCILFPLGTICPCYDL